MISRKVLLVILVFSALGALCLTPLWAQRPQPLPVIGMAPEFRLTDSTGKPFGHSDLLGKVWILNFIFTTCAGPCPMMSQKMAQLYNQFSGDDKVHFVSVSVNPEYDTPEVLAEYGKRYQADFTRWHFLTGEQAAIQKLSAEGFKVGSLDQAVNHSTRFILVDRKGRIRGYYLATDEDYMRRLPEDIRSVESEG